MKRHKSGYFGFGLKWLGNSDFGHLFWVTYKSLLLSIQAIKIAAGHDVAHFDTALSFIPLTDVLIKGKDWLFSANALKVEK